MAGETDYKTLRSILTNRRKVADVEAFLREIDPEHDPIRALVRRSRGLAKALDVTLQELDVACNRLKNGENPGRQMTIDELLVTARRSDPTLSDDDREAIGQSAEMYDDDGDEDDGDDIIDAAYEPADGGGDHSAKKVAEALQAAQPERGWTTEMVAWTGQLWRGAVLKWAAGKGQAPEFVEQGPMLEEMDLTQGHHREQLLRWLQIHKPVAWSEDVEAWAVQAHRRDRGEQVEVPEPPHVLRPTTTEVQRVIEMAQSPERWEVTTVTTGVVAGHYIIEALEAMEVLKVAEEDGVSLLFEGDGLTVDFGTLAEASRQEILEEAVETALRIMQRVYFQV